MGRDKGASSDGIDFKLCEILKNYNETLTDYLNQIDGVKLCVDLSTKNIDFDSVVRKSILFGTTTVCSMGNVRMTNILIRPDYPQTFVPDRFYLFLLKYRSAIKESLLFPIPSYFSINDHYGVEINYPASLLDIALSHSEVKKQIYEIKSRNKLLPAGTVDLYAPEIKAKRWEEIVALRVEEHDAYFRFQRRLMQMLQASQAECAETTLIELMKGTHEGILELRDRLSLSRKKLNFSAASTALGIASACLYITAPSDIGKFISTVLGTGTFFQSFKSFGDYYSTSEEIKSSDFYIPWKLTL